MTDYGIKISMSPRKKSEMQEQGFSLTAFKAVGVGVKVTKKSAAPTVWLLDPDFEVRTGLSWKQNYKVYHADTKFQEGAYIDHMNDQVAKPGEGWKVVEGGNFQEEPYDIENQIRIHNATKREYTIGLAQMPNPSSGADFVPLCAFRGLANTYREFRPLEQVVVTFTTGVTSVGTIFTRASADGFLVTAGDVGKPTEVTYGDDGVWQGTGDIVSPDNFLTACIRV
ncbi:hypothetical protein I5Q34_33615 [Streptomyces sp. AV19]|uniref:hypothetical protein n=1 Tax=Streptomyces sp. AV19 TaxID=2793068 RepID=UPI0018FE76C3|nr:hypothetical protein [Streptomyces sp. AV19]MBH1939141.1 hypothetical protein [Streptomyces sp. AV19]MDG4535293.1 hypothetical protein [Streptomyces sp. AV19]